MNRDVKIEVDELLNSQVEKKMFLEVLKNKNIETVFQPIVSLKNGKIFGYEALSRGPAFTPMHSPETLFCCAEKYGKVWELEYLCRLKAFKAAQNQKIEGHLFLNVNPNIMQDDRFIKGFTKEQLGRYEIDPKQVVFEITEREAINNISDFINTIKHYKEQDYRIAIDDAGAGYSGLNLISDIHPNFIKLDMKLIRDVDKDMTKQSLIKSMNEFARFTDTCLIAEGIETEDELEKLIEIGVSYGQGFLIQRPNRKIKGIEKSIVTLIQKEYEKKNSHRHKKQQVSIESICRQVETITPDMMVSEVQKKFQENPHVSGFCIVQKSVPIGVITRNDLYRQTSGQYGYILYANKPVSQIMDKDFTMVDCQAAIDYTGKIAMERENNKIYDFIIVTNYNRYYGIVTVKDLMEKLIEMEFVYAKHLNPLSELPGNIMIEEELNNAIKEKLDVCVLYFDLDNFKVYNDLYGFEKGDMVLKEFSLLLKEKMKGCFIGHIGGDDFIAIVPRNQAKSQCQVIIWVFDESIEAFYSEKDYKKGYIRAKNRNDVEEIFPLLSVSIAGVSSRSFKNIFELSEAAAKVKKICKKKAGSHYCLM